MNKNKLELYYCTRAGLLRKFPLFVLIKHDSWRFRKIFRNIFLISLLVSEIEKMEKSSPSIYRDVHGLALPARLSCFETEVKVNSVQKAFAKCFAVQILKFKSCKPYERTKQKKSNR